ncbi:hypothetical protein GMB34_11660 [Turicibacter sanguinis]|nr:hypothetical protein [Turicibacter sanguinis]MTN84849.1 hypothetical protein [Turicibacter sanguinis]MTN87671.1 hypothetical protein [Turicibacter sanguinis]MTN90493.1 hypothetical protein [Turicibacter sanguinis]MTN93415.1 hypothetical protein [Turicibacter sanguinis]
MKIVLRPYISIKELESCREQLLKVIPEQRVFSEYQTREFIRVFFSLDVVNTYDMNIKQKNHIKVKLMNTLLKMCDIDVQLKVTEKHMDKKIIKVLAKKEEVK